MSICKLSLEVITHQFHTIVAPSLTHETKEKIEAENTFSLRTEKLKFYPKCRNVVHSKVEEIGIKEIDTVKINMTVSISVLAAKTTRGVQPFCVCVFFSSLHSLLTVVAQKQLSQLV